MRVALVFAALLCWSPVARADAPVRDEAPHDWSDDTVGQKLVVGGIAVGMLSFVVWSEGRNDIKDLNASRTWQEFDDRNEHAARSYRVQQLGLLGMAAGLGLIAGGITHYYVTRHCEVTVTTSMIGLRGEF